MLGPGWALAQSINVKCIIDWTKLSSKLDKFQVKAASHICMLIYVAITYNFKE